MDGIIPVRAFLFQPGSQQAITLDHHLGVAGLHGEFEVVEFVLAGDAGEFERALDHAQRRVAEPVHDAVAERAVVGADAHGPAKLFAELHQRREFFFDAPQFGGVLLVGVFLDGEFL